MLMLLEALTVERDKRRANFKEEVQKRQLSRQVLQRLGECLAIAQLPRWQFIANGDEIVVVHNKDGAGTRHRVGAWTIDEEYRLAFGSERTEWITTESWVRVIDKAVTITAQVILDHDVQVNPEGVPAPGAASIAGHANISGPHATDPQGGGVQTGSASQGSPASVPQAGSVQPVSAIGRVPLAP